MSVAAASEPSRLAAQAVGVVESIAFLLQANLAEMAASLPPQSAIQVSGGLSQLDDLCQRLADLAGVPVRRVAHPEATARGTAFLLAGQPAHWADGLETTRFRPAPNPALAARHQRWQEAMTAALEQA